LVEKNSDVTLLFAILTAVSKYNGFFFWRTQY